MTEGPSLPPPRYSHTLHVEAPQPKPFAFLLGVALLAFAVPAGLVFAFLRFVADAPPPAGAEVASPNAQEPPPVAEVPPPAPMAVVFEIDAGSDAASADAASSAVAAEIDAGSLAPADAAPAPFAAQAAAPTPPPPSAPAPSAPVTWEMGMGILHSCRDTSGKYLDGYKECGTAGELDHYLAKVIAQDLVACDKDVPTTTVTVRANIDFGSNSGTLDVVDAKLMQLTSPWSACLGQKFLLEGLAKIRHAHPKYTLTYRVTPHLPGAPVAR